MVQLTHLQLQTRRKETHWIQGWVGARIGLEVLQTKPLTPAENGTPDYAGRRLLTTPAILLSQGGEYEGSCLRGCGPE